MRRVAGAEAGGEFSGEVAQVRVQGAQARQMVAGAVQCFGQGGDDGAGGAEFLMRAEAGWGEFGRGL